jgi:hypothetical protein
MCTGTARFLPSILVWLFCNRATEGCRLKSITLDSYSGGRGLQLDPQTGYLTDLSFLPQSLWVD